MKNIKYLALGALVALSLTSCDKDTEGVTDVTYYPVITLEGSDVLLSLGESYVDPGYSADLGGEDVTSQVVVSDNIDTSSIGLYKVSYTVTNPDGFSATATRNVIVYDSSVTLDMEGSYDTDMTETKYGAAKNPFSAYAASYGNTSQCTGIEFTKLAPGFYYCNDVFGGWYHQIRGYAERYCMTGYLSLSNDGSIDLVDSYVAGWGDSLDYLDGGYYDAENGVISYSLSYAGVIFMDIVLNKVD